MDHDRSPERVQDLEREVHDLREQLRVAEDERAQMADSLVRVETQLRQSQKMEAMGGLVGGVAHDVNNLMSVVLTYSSILAEGLPVGDPTRCDLEEIHAAGVRATDLTKQLLAFSRSQAPKPRVVNLCEAVGAMDRMLRSLIGEDVQLTVSSAGEVAPIAVDPCQLEQVIMNLAINARDAMPGGGKLTIEATNVTLGTEHAWAQPGEYVCLAVGDTGIGMNAETQRRIFEPFYTTKAQGKGTGLGLAVVSGVVKQSRGHIRVSSEPGVGTTFRIYFPRVEGARARPRSDAPVEGVRGGTETILLVEDDEAVRALSRTVLRRAGYHVLEAESGDDALGVCAGNAAAIDLLLTDVVMPRMSGPQLAERVKATRPGMKVLFMSGYTESSVGNDGAPESRAAFLAKPIVPASLRTRVREVLDAPGR
jgi:signal transduction histidine kinase